MRMFKGTPGVLIAGHLRDAAWAECLRSQNLILWANAWRKSRANLRRYCTAYLQRQNIQSQPVRLQCVEGLWLVGRYSQQQLLPELRLESSRVWLSDGGCTRAAPTALRTKLG